MLTIVVVIFPGTTIFSESTSLGMHSISGKNFLREKRGLGACLLNNEGMGFNSFQSDLIQLVQGWLEGKGS